MRIDQWMDPIEMRTGSSQWESDDDVPELHKMIGREIMIHDDVLREPVLQRDHIHDPNRVMMII